MGSTALSDQPLQGLNPDSLKDCRWTGLGQLDGGVIGFVKCFHDGIGECTSYITLSEKV
jgi:hypothetical protein